MLWGGAKYQQIALSQREMDFIESMKFTRDDILVAFKVPKPIVAVTDDVNRANAETAQEIFLSETIIPEVRRFIDKINEELITPDFGEEYILSFEDPVPVNREMRLAEFTAGVGKWITINEARKAEGREPIKGGDAVYQPMMNQPIGSVESSPSEKFYKNLYGRRSLQYRFKLKVDFYKAIEDLKTKIGTETKQKIKKKLKMGTGIQENSLFKDKEKRKQYWEYRTKDIDRKSKRMHYLVNSLANAQEERFIKKFNKEKPKDKSAIRKLFDIKAENQEFKKAILPLMFSIFKEAGEDALSLLRADKPFDTNKRLTKAKIGETIFSLLEKRAMFFANEVNMTTLLALTDTLAEGIETGEGIVKLRNRVKEEYDGFQNYRAERIARTETTAVVGEAHLEAYEQSETVEGKEWVATLDDRTRDEHLEMDGEIVEKDKSFSNGLMYPQEPNCRCTIAPVVNMV